MLSCGVESIHIAASVTVPEPGSFKQSGTGLPLVVVPVFQYPGTEARSYTARNLRVPYVADPESVEALPDPVWKPSSQELLKTREIWYLIASY